MSSFQQGKNNTFRCSLFTSMNACVSNVHMYRYGLTTIGAVLVFVVFWILLFTLNQTSDVTNITPSDKTVFWVSVIIIHSFDPVYQQLE